MGSNKVASGGDEEFMEDLITLAPLATLSEDSDCEIVSVSENESRPAIKKRPDREKRQQIELESSYGKGKFSLPAQFFDFPRNEALLWKCRPLKVNIVDCGKFPWYYSKKCGVRKPRPKTKQIYSLHNLLEDMRFKQKLKQLKLKVIEKSEDVVGKVNLTPAKLPDVDFKKNKGLVGLKIERKLVGLVFDEKNACKDNNKRKNKYTDTPNTADTPKKTAEGKETKAKITNDLKMDKNKTSKEQTTPSESSLEEAKKIVFRKDTSLKCSLNLNPLLSLSVQQKLLEITAKSVHQSTISPIDTANALTCNIQTNETFVGQKVKQIYENAIEVSQGNSDTGKKAFETTKKKKKTKNKLPSPESDTIKNLDVLKSITSKDENSEKLNQNLIQTNKITIEKTTTHTNEISTRLSADNTISGEIPIKTRMLKAPDANTLPNSQPASIKNANVIETQLAIHETPKQLNPNSKTTPNKMTESELVQIKTELEIKQELKDEVVATGNASIKDSKILVTQPEQEMSSPSPKSLLRSFRRSSVDVNTLVHTAPNQDVNEVVIWQPNPVQAVSNQNVDNLQWQQYNKPTLLATRNYPQNSQPPNLTASQPQLNVNNIQVTNQNIVTKPIVGDLKIQTVSQINKNIIKPTKLTLIDVVQNIPVLNDIQSNETQFNHPNNQPSQSTLQALNPVPISQKIIKPKEKTIVRVRNACMMPNRSRHVAPGPYTVPPSHQYRYQPIRNPKPVAQWQQNQHLAKRMPTLMQQLNQHPRSMSQSFWKPPPFNQDFYYRNHNAIVNDDTYYRNWVRHPPRLPPPPPPQYFAERRSRYVPPHERQKNNLSNNCLSKSKPNEGISNKEQPTRTTCLTALPPKTPITPDSQSIQGTLPMSIHSSPSVSLTSLPASSLSVPKLIQEVHTADVLYPNTSFVHDTNFANSPVIYTESSSQRNVNTHTNQQNVNRCILQINPNEKPIAPAKVSRDYEKEITNKLEMPNFDSFHSNLLILSDAANKVLLSEQQAKSKTLEKTNTASASKQTHEIKNLPKKRLYIPDGDDTENPPFNGTASTTEKSVPAILERNMKKGYSPPILPIPTIQKSLEILALAHAIKNASIEPSNPNNMKVLTSVKQSGYRNNELTKIITPKKMIDPNFIIENPPIKRPPPKQMGQSATKARKISIDEYIKRQDGSKSIDLIDERQDDMNKRPTSVKEQSYKRRVDINNENRGVDFQDLGYDSDHTSK